MNPQIDLNKINAKIQSMKKAAEELNQIGEDFPALARNTAVTDRRQAAQRLTVLQQRHVVGRIACR